MTGILEILVVSISYEAHQDKILKHCQKTGSIFLAKLGRKMQNFGEFRSGALRDESRMRLNSAGVPALALRHSKEKVLQLHYYHAHIMLVCRTRQTLPEETRPQGGSMNFHSATLLA